MPIEFNKKPGLVIYLTVGDPDMATTRDVALAAIDAGAEVLELGVPFSDPVADGPTIQRASERALQAGATLAGVIDLVARIRKTSQVPLVLFSYYNPVLQMGLERFGAAAAAAGADAGDAELLAGRGLAALRHDVPGHDHAGRRAGRRSYELPAGNIELLLHGSFPSRGVFSHSTPLGNTPSSDRFLMLAKQSLGFKLARQGATNQ